MAPRYSEHAGAGECKYATYHRNQPRQKTGWESTMSRTVGLDALSDTMVLGFAAIPIRNQKSVG